MSALSREIVALNRFPSLAVSTPRLVVRPLTTEDAPAVLDVFTNRQAERWLPVPSPYGPSEAYSWCVDHANERRDRGDGDHYGIVRRADDRLVGCAWTRRTDWRARSAEVWFAVSGAARGFGFASETVDALTVALVLEHGFHRVELRVATGNIAARRVATKCGFSYEGLLRDAGRLAGGRVDLELWSRVTADLRGSGTAGSRPAP